MSIADTFLEVYRIVLVVVTLSNEIFLPFHQWIVSPSKPPNKTNESFWPSAVTTTVAYALAEPLAYWLLTISSLPTTIVVIAFSLAYWFTATLNGEYLSYQAVLAAISRSGLNPLKIEDHDPESQVAAGLDCEKPSPPSRIKVIATLLLPVAFAAASNAALVLHRQSLSGAQFDDDATVWLFVVVGAALLTAYFFMHTLGSTIAKFVHRAPYAAGGKFADMPTRLLCLALVFVLRAAMSGLLGFNTLVTFGTVDQQFAKDVFDREESMGVRNGYIWLGFISDHLPWWARPIDQLINFVVFFALGTLLMRLRARIQEKKRRVAEKYLGPAESLELEHG